jgi:hypothetical protein
LEHEQDQEQQEQEQQQQQQQQPQESEPHAAARPAGPRCRLSAELFAAPPPQPQQPCWHAAPPPWDQGQWEQ